MKECSKLAKIFIRHYLGLGSKMTNPEKRQGFPLHRKRRGCYAN